VLSSVIKSRYTLGVIVLAGWEISPEREGVARETSGRSDNRWTLTHSECYVPT
jgi:hypothetical protein